MFSGEFPASSQQSLTGAMNTMELANEQMPYMFYPPQIAQEAPSSFIEPPFAEHQTESVPELVCSKCETPQSFKNKSEFKYVRIGFWV